MKQPVLPAQIEEVARKYRIQDPKVESFLHEHPAIVGLLLEARPHIERHFGKHSFVDLELWHEYGWPDQKFLAAAILTRLDAHTASGLLDRFWDDWWMEASARPEAWGLLFDIAYAGEPETLS